MKCYGSVADIEGDVDLVVIGVPAQGVLAVLESSAQKKVPFAVVLSGGFRESGPEGVLREEKNARDCPGGGHAYHRAQLPRFCQHPFSCLRRIRQHYA
ncbi:hypothetical protein ACFS4T_20035 [Pseudomonas lini]